MRLFKDKELEERINKLADMIMKQDEKINKLLKKSSKPKNDVGENRERIERIDKSFQKLFNYNEDIAVKGYRK